MNANEFVKEHGWEYSKHIVNEGSVILIDLDYNKLKSLVESWELVDDFGGLETSKQRLHQETEGFFLRWLERCGVTLERYKQAILDVESCS